jgi:hypothetical protein
MAVRKPRVEDERRKCKDMVFVMCRCARRSGSDIDVDVRSIVEGTDLGKSSKVSMSHAMRSRVHRTDPARELMTSGSSRGEIFSAELADAGTFRFAAMVMRTTILRS